MAVSAKAVQHNGKFGNNGIRNTAGHSCIGDNGEATASTGRIASNPGAVTAATKGGADNSSASHSHMANCNYPTTQQCRAQRYSNR